MSLRLESPSRPCVKRLTLAFLLLTTVGSGWPIVAAQEFGPEQYVESFGTSLPIESQAPAAPAFGSTFNESQIVQGPNANERIVEPAFASPAPVFAPSGTSAVVASFQANKPTTSKPSRSTLSNRTNANQTRKTLRAFWKQQADSGRAIAYPTIKLDSTTRIGHLGTGNRFQSLTMVKEIAEDEYLVRSKKSVFLFRRFDFSNYQDGRTVPAPGLCEVTGKHDYKDKEGKKRSVLIIEPLATSSVPIPSTIAKTKPKNADSKSVSSSIVNVKETPRAKPDDVSTKPRSKRPRFIERMWHTKDKQYSAVGTLVGVGDEVIWLKVKGGSVIRINLSRLTEADRKHAVTKRHDILEYRRLKKQLEASVIR